MNNSRKDVCEINRRRLLQKTTALVGVGLAGVPALSTGERATSSGAKVYLTETGTGSTTLFTVELVNDSDGEARRAELTPIWPNSGTDNGNFNQTDAIAGTPDGNKIILFDKKSGHLGVYDVSSDTFSDKGEVSGRPTGEVLLTVSPSGTLWMASEETERVYTVDIAPPSITDQGDTGIDLNGADMVFVREGTLFVWANNSGLFQIPDPSVDTTAQQVGSVSNSSLFLTGLAVRDAGTGPLIGSEKEGNDIVTINRTTGEIERRYPMRTPDGNGGFDKYKYRFGDMAVGKVCTECESSADQPATTNVEQNQSVTDQPASTEVVRAQQDDGAETVSRELPGFGIGSAITGLGGAAYVLKRLLSSDDEGDESK